MKRIAPIIVILISIAFISQAQVSEQEFQALKALYNSTNGDQWKNRTGWENINTTATKDNVTTAWNGIRGIADGHITEIYFNNNNLSGPLPVEIGNLIWLKEFTIDSDQLSGMLPDEIGEMSSLESINFRGNKLTGPLPQTFGNLLNLQFLTLSRNPFNSTFQGEIFQKLSKLKNIQFYLCGFTGEIPDIFDSLPSLTDIDMSENHFEGELPPSLSRLKKILTISLGQNQLSGNLPSLDSCKLITKLYFWNNNFSGTIPNSYSNLPNLNYLYLSDNSISGFIPPGIFRPAFSRFYIDQNFFTFEGLEPVFNNLKVTSLNNFKTDKYFELKQNNYTCNAGEALNLNAQSLSVHNLGGNNNRYKWFRNNEEVYSGNSPIYNVTSAGAANAGIYRFEVTNTVVTGLTLKSENITVSVTGSNQPPTNITLSKTNIDENFLGNIGTLTATDPDAGDTHTYALATGNGTNDKDNSKFSITGNQLKINSEANFETNPTLNILISVNDGNGGIYTKPFVITVNNINEAPVYNGQLTSNTIDENAANGSTALSLMAFDPEGSPVTFSITSGNNDGAFGINGDKLIVADNSKLDYDTKNQYNLTVNASDGTLSTNAILIISLNKINKMPEVENATFSIIENSPNGTVVGAINASDPEGQPLTYSFLTGNELSAFSFSGKNIVITKAEYIDFEQHPVFNITFNVSDGISNVQVSITINLTNVAEPTDNAIATFLISGMVGEPEIDYTAHTIRAYVHGVNLNLLNAEFTLSSNATANPVSGSTFDFTTPQTITVTSQSGDTQEWLVTVTFPTANIELGNYAMKLYPNPACDFLNVSGLDAGSKMQIVSLSGQVMYCKRVDNLDESIKIAHFQKGVYLLLVENKGERSIQKFIKE